MKRYVYLLAIVLLFSQRVSAETVEIKNEIAPLIANAIAPTPASEPTPAPAAVPTPAPVIKKYSDDPQINDIITKTVDNYHTLKSFTAKGQTISKIKTNGTTTDLVTDFDMKMMRPNLYLITWSSNAPYSGQSKGAVWNAGEGPYNYQQAFNNYQKMSTDESSLGAAAGVSSSVTHTVPFLFLGFSKNIFDSLNNIKLKDSEQINGDDCYVLNGESLISNDHTFWISKKNLVIVKTSLVYGKTPDMSQQKKLTDEEMATSLKDMGMEVTEENKQKLNKMMDIGLKAASQIKLEGTHEEIYTGIQINPELTKDALAYHLPEGTKSDNSAYKNILKNVDSMSQTLQLAQGSQIDHQQALQLEEKLKANPEDLESRMTLLGYYLGKDVNAAKKARYRHILWIIQNKPDFDGGETASSFMMLLPQIDGEAYQQARNSWLQQVEKNPKNIKVLINAASFFRVSDRELSENLFKKVKEIDPSYQSLMELYGNAAKTSK